MKVKDLFTAVAGALVGFFVAFQLVSSVYTTREAPTISHDSSIQALRGSVSLLISVVLRIVVLKLNYVGFIDLLC